MNCPDMIPYVALPNHLGTGERWGVYKLVSNATRVWLLNFEDREAAEDLAKAMNMANYARKLDREGGYKS